MASSVCAFAVSPAPATSFISPPLYRTSRQWRCVYSARQQKEPVRRLRKGLARFVVVLADEESDVQLGISRKRPPIAKPTTPRHFSTASTQSRYSHVRTECVGRNVAHNLGPIFDGIRIAFACLVRGLR